MGKLIVGCSSQSGKKEFRKGNTGTSRSEIIMSDGNKINPGLFLKDIEKIKEGVNRILEDTILAESDEINVTMHAMAMSGMDKDYPKLLIQTLKNSLSKTSNLDSEEVKEEIGENIREINALLISFHEAASKKNPSGSHAFYPVRDIKGFMENSLLTCDADKRKIVDLEIFDSPSSKVLGLTFIGVIGQFLEFLEANKNHAITISIKENLKNFLGDDYEELLSFFGKYPLSGKLKKGQLSMRKLGEKEKLNGVSNKLASRVNFAKLSYISGAISNLYLELAMADLVESKDEILNSKGDRFLLSWERIKNIYNNPQLNSNFEELVNELKNKIELKKSNKTKTTSGVFKLNKTYTEGGEIECEFNPTKENFDIIGNNEKGGHFGVIPLFMVDGLIYDLGLLDKEKSEYIKETKPISMIFTGNEVVITRKDDKITLCNKYNRNEIFTEIYIGIQSKSTEKIDGGLILGKKYNKYLRSGVPHGKKWFNIFSKNILDSNPFGLKIDSRAKIIEAIGVKIGRNYFTNPIEGNIESLKETFPRLRDFSKLRGIFSKVKTIQMDPEFERKIEGREFDIKIKDLRGDSRLLNVNVCVIVGSEIISEHSLYLS